MLNAESLPIVLVSASDEEYAKKVISEVVGEEAVGSGSSAGCEWVTWSISNKYYEAEVRLVALGPRPAPATLLPHVEAHLICLAPHQGEESAEQLWRGAGEAAARAHVRLALGEGGEAGEAWALRRRYELVPPQRADGLEPDEWGARRLRAALHAHTWRGLRLRAGAARRQSGSESGESWGEWQSGEPWGESWGALGGAREALRSLPDEQRRARAEALLAAVLSSLSADDDL